MTIFICTPDCGFLLFELRWGFYFDCCLLSRAEQRRQCLEISTGNIGGLMFQGLGLSEGESGN